MRYRTATPVPMIGLRRELDRFMEEAFGRAGANGFVATTWSPAMDLVEDEAGLLVEFELPGLSPEQVEVTTDQGVLTVRGEKTATRHREGVRAIMTERSEGKFVRSLQLPQGVDESKIDAEFAHGLLRIRVPRAALPQARKVEIRPAARQPVVESTTPAAAGD